MTRQRCHANDCHKGQRILGMPRRAIKIPRLADDARLHLPLLKLISLRDYFAAARFRFLIGFMRPR